MAKHLGPHILQMALAIKYATSSGKKRKITTLERRLMYSYLLLELGKAFAETLNTRSQVSRLLKNERVRWGFIELIIAIELINVCQGKRPSGGFIKAFRDCVPDKGMDNQSFLRHLATLLYLDDKNKLFKAIIENPLFPGASSKDIIKLALHAVSNERYAQRDRLDSDAVKIKGAVKKARIIPNQREISTDGGDDYTIEEAFVPAENFYKDIFKDKLTKKLRSDLQKYIQKSNRSRRQRNTLAVVDYILATKEKKINIMKVSKLLNMSRKTFHQILKALRSNIGFKRLLNVSRINNQ